MSVPTLLPLLLLLLLLGDPEWSNWRRTVAKRARGRRRVERSSGGSSENLARARSRRRPLTAAAAMKPQE